MQCYGYNNDLVIITEDECGKPYCVQSKYIMDVLDDWRGEAMMCPANDARVFLAIHNSNPINPHLYTDWASLMEYLTEMVCR